MAAAAPQTSLGNLLSSRSGFVLVCFPASSRIPLSQWRPAVSAGRLQTAWSLCKSQKAPAHWAHLSKLPSWSHDIKKGLFSAVSIRNGKNRWIESPCQGNSSLENHSSRRCAKFTYPNHFVAGSFCHGHVSQLYDSLYLEWVYTSFPTCIFLCCCMASKW